MQGYNNRNRIYKFIYLSKKRVSKSMLEKKLKLSRPTVAHYIKQLCSEGYIETSCFMDSTGGRKAQTLKIVGDKAFAVGIYITYKSVKIVIINLLIEIKYSKKIYIQFEDSDLYYDKLMYCIRKILKENNITKQSLIGIGIALPGIISDDNMILTFAPTLCSNALNLTKIKERISVPVFFQNDATAAGYAKCWNIDNNENMVFLCIERGIGGVIINKGKIYHGDSGSAAEFGHMCLKPNGRTCNCGQKGCLEAYCSTKSISDDLGISLEEFFTNIKKGVRKYEIIWEEYLEYLAIGILNLYRIFDCKIIISGIIEPYLYPYFNDLKDIIKKISVDNMSIPTLCLSKYDENSINIGVSLHFINKFINKI